MTARTRHITRQTLAAAKTACTIWMCFAIISVALAVTDSNNEGQVPVERVLIYNWPDYIPDSVLQDFTNETGIKVTYTTFDNNEIMYAKLKLLNGRGFDVIVPSTYMVSRMRDEGFIRAIDSVELENFKYLNPELMNKSFDPDNNYSIPYMWGSTGIAVNTEKAEINTVTKWKDLWHTHWRGSLLLVDDMRDVFHIALKINGHSTNTTDPDEISQAYRLLHSLMPGVASISSTPGSDLLGDEIDLGAISNGEVIVAQKQKPAIQYVYPDEGASFWMDSFVIPSRAVNLQNAYQFIDFMLRPEVAARCVQELGYATANLAALELLADSIRNNPVIFPPSDILAAAEFQQDIGEAMILMNLYWETLKTLK